MSASQTVKGLNWLELIDFSIFTDISQLFLMNSKLQVNLEKSWYELQTAANKKKLLLLKQICLEEKLKTMQNEQKKIKEQKQKNRELRDQVMSKRMMNCDEEMRISHKQEDIKQLKQKKYEKRRQIRTKNKERKFQSLEPNISPQSPSKKGNRIIYNNILIKLSTQNKKQKNKSQFPEISMRSTKNKGRFSMAESLKINHKLPQNNYFQFDSFKESESLYFQRKKLN